MNFVRRFSILLIFCSLAEDIKNIFSANFKNTGQFDQVTKKLIRVDVGLKITQIKCFNYVQSIRINSYANFF